MAFQGVRMSGLILASALFAVAISGRIPTTGYGGGYGGYSGGYGGGYPGMSGGWGGGMWGGGMGGGNKWGGGMWGGGMWGGFGGGEVGSDYKEKVVEEDVSVNCRVVMRNRTDAGTEVVGPRECMSIKQLTSTLRYGEMVSEMTGGACSWNEGSSQCLCPADKETCTSEGRGGCYLHTDSKTKVSTCISKAERFHNQLAGLLAKRGKKDFSMKIQYGASAAKGRLPYGLMGPRYIETGRNPYMQHHYSNYGYRSNSRYQPNEGGYGGYGGLFAPYSSAGYSFTPYGYGGQSGDYEATHGFVSYQQQAYGTQPQGYPVAPQAYGPTQPYQPSTTSYQQRATYSAAPPSYQAPTNLDYQQPPPFSQAPPSYQPLSDYQQPPTYSQAPSYQPPSGLDYLPPSYLQAPPPTSYQQPPSDYQPYQETSKP